jgi:hypothetical protein
VRLAPKTELRKGVDLWPMIADAKTPAELKVNAALTRLNARLKRSVGECDVEYRESLKRMGALAKGQDPVEEDWTRTIDVTMRGPGYLSMVATDYSSCGGVHPNDSQMAMVFDLQTGTPVNWLALLPKAAGASSYSDTVMDGSKAGGVLLPALKKMYDAAADADCKGVPEGGAFLLWPDAAKGTLVAVAFDVSHAIQACAVPMDISLEKARTLGFSEAMLGAIAEAHKSVPAKR